MNFEALCGQALMFLSAGLIYFGFKKRIYDVSKLVFVFLLIVFALVFIKTFLSFHTFINVHFVVLLLSSTFLIKKLILEPKKYWLVVPVLLTSISVITLVYFFQHRYFFPVHNFVLIFDVLFVTTFVVYIKFLQTQRSLV